MKTRTVSLASLALCVAVVPSAAVGASAASASGDVTVPAAVAQWFATDPDAQSSLHDKDDLDELTGASPKIAKALKSGTRAEFGRIARVARIDRPEMDLRTGKLSQAPRALPDALTFGNLYCAMIRVGDLFTDADLCAEMKGDGSVHFVSATYSNGFLDKITQLPTKGYVVTYAGAFTFDVAKQTLTAMDEGALYSVPQGTVSATDLITALARDDAERALLNKLHPDANTGSSPLFFATPEEKAKHDAEIADLLAEADGTSTQPAASQSTPSPATTPAAQAPVAAAATDDRSPTTGLVIAGVAVLAAALAVTAVGTLRRRRRGRQQTVTPTTE